MKSSRVRAVLVNSALVLFSLLVCFAVLEVGVRLLVDFQEIGPRRVYDLQPDKINFLPGTNRLYESSEYSFTLSTNSQGRRDVEWSAETLADPDNVLFVGDSFTLGYGVEHEHTVAARLEAWAAESGRPREVFNFGAPGGSPPDYQVLLDQGLELGIAARTVLVGIFVGNDFYASMFDPPQPKRKEESSEPKRRSPIRWARDTSHLIRFLEQRVSQSARMTGWVLTAGRLLGVSLYDTSGSYIFLRSQTPEQEALFRRILEIFGEIKRRCDQEGRDLYMVVFPNKIQVENGDELTNAIYDVAKPERLILEYCDEIGVPCLDLLPVLTAEYERTGRPLFFPMDRHLTEEGSRVAADAIIRFLVERADFAGRASGAHEL